MMRYLILLQLLWLVLVSSCGGGAGGVGSFLAKGDAPAVSSVNFANDQLIINGSNLAGVTSVSVEGEDFDVESISETQLIVNAQQALAFIAGATYNLLVSNAFGAASYSITFTPDNNSITTNMIVDNAITTNKIADEAITESKLSNMGASDGDFLQWDQATSSWIPTTLNGLTYLGTWDATTAAPADPNAGEYYVISVAGDTDLGSQTDAWSVGDWAIYNGSDWQKIDNSNAVTNVFGRQGAITGVEGDYNIDLLGDVDTTTATPADGQVLTWDQAGGNWVPATESDPKVGTLTSGKWCTSDGSVINCDAMPGAETDPVFGAHAASSITSAGSGMVISVAERNGITNNATSISTNATNIATNDSDIATNVTNISTNAGNISTNTGNIATNVSNISTNTGNISTNATNISSNDTDIATNASNISSNDTDIATNVTNISTNATNISSNDSDIAAQATAISGKVDLIGTTGQEIVGGAADNSNLTLTSSTGTPGYVLMNVSGGNVGVGTDTPMSDLHVRDATGGASIRIDSNSSDVPTIHFAKDGSVKWQTFISATDDYRIYDNTNAKSIVSIDQGSSSIALKIDSSGNVGIGSISPTAKLDVVGAIRAQQLCDENGNNCHDLDSGTIAVSGDLSASGGNVSVGTTDTTYNITFDGDTNQTIGVQEQTTGAGSSLTINSGAAQSGSTDQAGGNLILSSGSATGSGGSAIEFKTATAGASGTVTATPSTKMVITEAGDVGIGTASPREKMEVMNGSIAVSNNNGTTTYSKFYHTDPGHADGPRTMVFENTSQSGSTSDPVFKFFSTSAAQRTAKLTILRNGDVGIGSSAPTGELTVEKDGSNSEVHIGSYKDTAAASIIRMKRARNTQAAPAAVVYDDGLGSIVAQGHDGTNFLNSSSISFEIDGTPGTNDMPGRITFATTAEGNPSATERMRIDSGGRVGIGTTNPATKFHIEENFNGTTEVAVRNLTSGTDSRATLRFSTASGDAVIGHADSAYTGRVEWQDGLFLNSNGNGGIHFATDAVTKMSINDAGNVGIGSTDPAVSLDIYENATSSARIRLGNQEGNFDILGDNADLRFYAAGATPTFDLYDDTNARFYGRLYVDDRLGIGTTSPAVNLQVKGASLGTAENDTVDLVRFNIPDGNQSNLEVRQIRTSAGTDWFSSATRLQEKVDSTWMSYIQFNGTDNNHGMSFGTGHTTVAPGNVTEVMRLNSSGYVGIGTTSPRAKLDVGNVTGNVAIFGKDVVTDQYIAMRDTSAGIYFGLDASLNGGSGAGLIQSGINKGFGFLANTETFGGADPDMYIDTTGYVGIGTTDPGVKLDIDAAGTTFLRGTYPAGQTLQFVAGLVNSAIVQKGTGSLTFHTNSDGNITSPSNTRMTIDNSGFVGIGETSPIGQLHVSSADFTVLTVESTHATYDPALQLVSNGVNDYDDWTMRKDVSDGDKLQFRYDNNQLITVDTSGNVGIGITSPLELLHVVAAANGVTGGDPQDNIIFGTGGTEYNENSPKLIFGGGGSKYGASIQAVNELSYGRKGIAFSTHNTAAWDDSLEEQVRITSTGNVGIGTISPAAKLHVDGSGAGGGLCVTSDGTCGAVPNGGQISAETTLNTGADYAEYFKAEEQVEAGEIVGINLKTGLVRAYRKGDHLLGIVSSDPGVIGNSADRENSILVALMGQVDFNDSQTIIDNGLVKSLDNQIIGYLLSSGKVYINIGSVSSADHYARVMSLEAENKEIKEENIKIKTENREIKEFLCSKYNDAPICNK